VAGQASYNTTSNVNVASGGIVPWGMTKSLIKVSSAVYSGVGSIMLPE